MDPERHDAAGSAHATAYGIGALHIEIESSAERFWKVGGASMREFHCKDVGMPDCSFVAKGKDDDEVMRKATEHAKRDHHMQAIPPELERRARGSIRESTESSKR